jgi:vacuolar-type H+-ATPase subunit D/Vma8
MIVVGDQIPLHIYMGSFHLEFSFPAFFEYTRLSDIRTAFKYMRIEPWRNVETLTKLTELLPAWRDTLTAKLAQTEYDVADAEVEAELKRRRVEALGSSLNASISEARGRLSYAARKGNKEAVQSAQEELRRVKQPITDYNEACLRVKSLKNDIPRITKALLRCKNVITYYEGSGSTHSNIITKHKST